MTKKRPNRKAIDTLVLKSTDGRCAICLEDTNVNYYPIEKAHIVPEKHGGPYTFWNLIPTCPNHNYNTREAKKPDLIPPDLIRKAFHYWTFIDGREDVAIKVCLYKLYEYLVLKEELNESERTDAHKLIYHILWTSRTFLFSSVINQCLELIKLIPCGGGFEIDEKFDNIESLIYLSDTGKSRELKNFILENPNSDEIYKRAKSLVWRVIQDPSFPQKQIEKLKDVDGFIVSEATNYYKDAKDFDLRLRVITSELIKALIKNDKGAISKVFDSLLKEEDNIRLAKGCSHVYQRLYPFLKAAYEEDKSDKIKDILAYIKQYGTKSPIRKLLMNKKEIEIPLLKKHLPIEQEVECVNIGKFFIPLQNSYADSIEKNRRLVNEADLLYIIDNIINNLKNKHDN